MLILLLIQYLQNVIFRFEKGLKGQNHSSSDSIWKTMSKGTPPSPSLDKPCVESLEEEEDLLKVRQRQLNFLLFKPDQP